MSKPNVTGIVELADPENHTMEPKITTLSYIQPELWEFKDFPIETMLIFSNFHQNSVKYENSLLYLSKGSSLRRTASFDVLSVKIHAGVSAVGDWKNQKK